MTVRYGIKPKDLLTLLASPTRFVIERFDPKPIRAWNWVFRCVLIASLVGLGFTTGESVRHWRYSLGYLALWLFPFSRINELALAFWHDAFQRLNETPDKTKIRPIERLKLLVTAYFEVAGQFGILYFSLFSLQFNPHFASVIDALYFSVVTITTVGYGDILPKSHWTRMTCIYELLVGFIIIAFALGAYLTTSLNEGANEGRR